METPGEHTSAPLYPTWGQQCFPPWVVFMAKSKSCTWSINSHFNVYGQEFIINIFTMNSYYGILNVAWVVPLNWGVKVLHINHTLALIMLSCNHVNVTFVANILCSNLCKWSWKTSSCQCKWHIVYWFTGKCLAILQQFIASSQLQSDTTPVSTILSELPGTTPNYSQLLLLIPWASN